jgi:hypothetical protein
MTEPGEDRARVWAGLGEDIEAERATRHGLPVVRPGENGPTEAEQ